MLQTHFHGWRRAYFWMAFIRPPAEMMFWIKGGKGSAWNTLPLVSSVMIPVSKSTLTVSPALMASTASGHSMMGRPMLMLLR